MVRGVMIGHILLILSGSVLWIGSIYLEESRRMALIWMAIVMGEMLLSAFVSERLTY
jgi:hypothetical protein